MLKIEDLLNKDHVTIFSRMLKFLLLCYFLVWIFACSLFLK